MRDPERIPRILAKVLVLWREDSDQRFGQFLNNYLFGERRLYYQEDDDTEARLDELIGEKQ